MEIWSQEKCFMEEGLIFNVDPVLFRIGAFHLRYYSVIFAAAFFVGFFIWKNQIVRGGYPKELAEGFLLWAFIATIAGGRLGEALFYESSRYLGDPLSLLYVWRGGLSSHGVTVGLVVALFLYALKSKINVLEIFDRFSMTAALGAAMIRLGNFFNSEIVGRATDLPWAVKFIRYDGGNVARHPSQLYEAGLGFFVLFILLLVDRWAGKEKRPLGLLTGLFFTLYFFGRFLIEFVKEPLVLRDSVLTMGQYLSIIPLLAGGGLLIWSKTNSQKKRNSLDRF
jgi:prolipoprotein diacylglyceryl transferase